jgi:thioesterase domain-containing protein
VLRQRFAFHLRNLVTMPPRDIVGYLREKARVARDGELRSLLRRSRSPDGDHGRDGIESLDPSAIQTINDQASIAYRPRPYHGVLTVVKPRVNYDFYPDPKMGWGEFAVGGLAVVELDVNPHAMLGHPHVAALARELQARLGASPGVSSG